MSSTMQCGECGSFKTTVCDSRATTIFETSAVRRRRVCKSCGHRFTTFEIGSNIPNALEAQIHREVMTAIQKAMKIGQAHD